MNKLLLGSCLLLLLFACEEKDTGPETSFARIYDNLAYDLEYLPIDVAEVSDGFLILAGQEFERGVDNDGAPHYMGIQLIKVDEEGFYEGEYLFDESLVVPVGDMMRIDSAFYFLAMDPNTLGFQLVSTDGSLDNVQVTSAGGGTYPLAASLNAAGNQIVALGYNVFNAETEIYVLNTDGSVDQSAGYSIGPGSDVLDAVVNHFTNPDERSLSFFCGQAPSGQYFFNGFYNYNLSLVFTDFGSESERVIGQFTNGGIRNVLPKEGGGFAVGGFQYDENYLLGDAGLAGTVASVDLFTEDVTELRGYTPIEAVNYTLAETTTYTIFAAETESRQIALYFIDQATDELVLTEKIGYIYPFTLASLRVDNENHLLVLGTTYVAGRFRRIYLNRIAEEEIQGWFEPSEEE